MQIGLGQVVFNKDYWSIFKSDISSGSNDIRAHSIVYYVVHSCCSVPGVRRTSIAYPRDHKRNSWIVTPHDAHRCDACNVVIPKEITALRILAELGTP